MVVNSVPLSRDLPGFTGFFEIIGVVITRFHSHRHRIFYSLRRIGGIRSSGTAVLPHKNIHDGYQGYNNLPGIRRCSCWAHIRRYFIDAVSKGKQYEYDYSQPAVQGVQYCNRLFAIEDSINKKYPGDHEKRKQLRLEKEKPVLEAFWSWLDQQKPVQNTRMDKAVDYVLNRRDTAQTYLEDGRCSFINNLSENAIRPFAVGRKNWLFSNSVDGVNASAVVYTMVGWPKHMGLISTDILNFCWSTGRIKI